MIYHPSDAARLYRRIYRQGLRAVQYSSPARHVLRQQLNHAFRTGKQTDLHAQKIENTILFLENATRETGLEHRILKNLLHVWWWILPGAKLNHGYLLK